jgi:hypothetical protein
MKSGKTFICIVLTAIYLFFPGNGLAFVNHIFHDKGLPEIDCPCCSKTERHTENPLSGHNDECGAQNMGCACISHIPLTRYSLESDQNAVLLPLRDPLYFLTEMYYPIFIPPKIFTA